MANFELTDYSLKVTEVLTDELIAALYEIGGELVDMTGDNSRQGHKYGKTYASNLWKYKVDEGKLEVRVGSEEEAAYWEEFGTGEHAADTSKSRKGWWIYVDGQDSGSGGEVYTEEEAKAVAASMRAEGIPAHATNGIEPNRPLFRAFQSARPVVEAIFEAKLKGMG